MKENDFSFLKKIMNNPSTTHTFLAIILVILGLFLVILTPVGVSKWYHVFFKLMMFMFFVMSFIFSIVALIKGILILLNQDTKYDKKLTSIGSLTSILIILIIVLSLYSNPYLIDIFGLTKKTPIPSPNLIQQW